MNFSTTANDQPVVVLLFMVGQGAPNARIGHVIYDQRDPGFAGRTPQHGEFWLGWLGAKPKMAERPLQRVEGPLSGGRLLELFGTDSPPVGDLINWEFQFRLDLINRV